MDGVNWKFGVPLCKPDDVWKKVETTLKEGCKSEFFRSPVIYLLIFLPIAVWLNIVLESNLYENKINKKTSGRQWAHDITITELMKLFGIILHM